MSTAAHLCKLTGGLVPAGPWVDAPFIRDWNRGG